MPKKLTKKLLDSLPDCKAGELPELPACFTLALKKKDPDKALLELCKGQPLLLSYAALILVGQILEKHSRRISELEEFNRALLKRFKAVAKKLPKANDKQGAKS